MTTIKKMKAIILFVAVLAGTNVFAQELQQSPQDQQTEVKDSELQKFADIAENVIKISQEGQQKMLKEIEGEGLTGERFQQIAAAQNNPSAAKEQPSQEELAKVEKINEKLQAIDQDLQKKQMSVVEDGGMSVERYQEIAMAVQSDQNLLQKYQKIMIEKNKENAQE